MKNHSCIYPLAVALILIAGPSAVAAAGSPVTDVHVGPDALTLTPRANFESALLIVRGPGDFERSVRAAEGSPHLTLTASPDLADGLYRWRLYVNLPSGEQQRQRGLFFVEAGRLEIRETVREQPTETRRELAPTATSSGVEAQGFVADDFITIDDDVPDGSTFLNIESDVPVSNQDFFVQNDGGILGFRPANSNSLAVPPVTIDRDGEIIIEPDGNHNGLDMEGQSPGIRLIETDEDTAQWIIQASTGVGGDSIRFQDLETPFSAPLVIASNSPNSSGIRLIDDGKIGLGTFTPAADLDIHDLDTNGFSAFRVNAAATWAVATTPTGVVTFNKIGSGGQEMTIRTRKDGDGAETLEVQGSVLADSFNVPSSRHLKTDIRAVEPAKLLDKVARLPVSEWRFKHGSEDVRHVGPMAEDFQVLFGLGDGSHLSTVDVQGIALAAIQGLHEQLEAKNARIEDLERRLEALEAAAE